MSTTRRAPIVTLDYGEEITFGDIVGLSQALECIFDHTLRGTLQD